MTLYPDRDDRNVDWAKRTWDISPRNVEELRRWLEAYGMTAEQFKRMPIYQFNVDKMPWLLEL